MVISELFVAIGIQVNNKDALDETEKSLKRSTMEATKIAAALSVVTAAFVAMANAAGQAGMALKSFALNTGLGVSELQRWEYAAQANGVAANQLRTTILALQKQQAQIALGEGDISGFQFFGIDPRQNPFQVLTQLRQRIRQIGDDQIHIARERASALGINDELFQFLRLANPELQKQLELTEADTIALAKMQGEFNKLRISVIMLGQKFVSALAAPMEKFLKVMGFIISKFAIFVNWLNRGSSAANAVKWILGGVLVVVGTLTVAFVALAGVLAAATAAMLAFDIAASPIVLVILAIGLAIVGFLSQVLVLLAIWDDLMVALQGGDALLTPLVKKWKEWAMAIKEAYDIIKEFTKFGSKEGRANFAASTSFVWDNITDGLSDFFNRASNPVPAGSSSSTVNNNPQIQVNVNGAGNPREVGNAVVDSLKQAVSDASFQQPAANY